MNNQQSNDDVLRQNLLLEEFKYWDCRRNQVAPTELEVIRKNIEKLRSSIFSLNDLFPLFQ